MISFAGRDVEAVVQGAGLRGGLVDELLVGALVGDVEGLGAGRPTEFTDLVGDRRGGRLVQIGGHNLRAFLGQADRRRTANVAGRRTGKDRDPVP